MDDSRDTDFRPHVNRLLRNARTTLSAPMRAQVEDTADRLFHVEELRGPLRADQVLGDYRIVRLLGSGGQAYVYEAEHLEAGDRVALKVPRDEVASRLLHEAKLATRLEHPHIARLLGIDADSTPPYLVVEYCPGGGLDVLLESHPNGLDAEHVGRIARGLLQALGFAHRQGIVHRDLKPANVLFSEAGEVKLSDFGIGALSTPEEVSHSMLTASQDVHARAGTLAYMAPEQVDPGRLSGEPLDGRTDLFAFGKLIFHMLTGASPTTIRPPSRLRPDLDPAWDDLVFRLLEERREDRFASVHEALEALGRIPGASPEARLPASELALPDMRLVPPAGSSIEVCEANGLLTIRLPAAGSYTANGLAGAIACALGLIAGLLALATAISTTMYGPFPWFFAMLFLVLAGYAGVESYRRATTAEELELAADAVRLDRTGGISRQPRRRILRYATIDSIDLEVRPPLLGWRGGTGSGRRRLRQLPTVRQGSRRTVFAEHRSLTEKKWLVRTLRGLIAERSGKWL